MVGPQASVKADSVRRPAVLVRISISQDFEERERNRIGNEYQGGVDEALNRMGRLPVDTTFATGSDRRRLEGLDGEKPVARARETGRSTFSSWARSLPP